MLSEVYIILSVITAVTVASFIESPHDLVTLPEPPTVAPFFCQHSSAHDIVWLVNETSLTQSLPPGISACTITLSYGQILNRVKIETRPEYNGTMVVCVAVFFDGSRAVERTTPAFLILEDDVMPLPQGFLKVPQSQVVALGERGVFDCQHCAANGVDWRLSGKRLTANTLPEGVMITYNLPKSLTCGAVHTLIIEDIVTYNRSTIQCEVYINDVPDERSEQALLLSQDQLGPATDLRRIFISNQESVTYIWQPPFSLNITSADPDIAYCVSIDEVTCPVNERINEVHDCNITQPYYELPNQFDTGKIYSIAITPRANIPGIELIETDNGTYSTTIHEDAFISFTDSTIFYAVDIRVRPNGRDEIHVQLVVQVVDSSRVRPNNLIVTLNSVYAESQNDNITCPTTLSHTEANSAHYVVQNCSTPLNLQQLYLASIQIPKYECATLNSNFIISTHFIQNISAITASQSSVIKVSGDLVDTQSVMLNDKPIGFLAIAYSNSDSQLRYGITRLSVEQPHSNVTLSRSPGHQYRVSVYGIGQDGLPNRTSAVEAKSAIEVLPDQLPTTETDDITKMPALSASYNDGCITCTFLNKSASPCVVIASKKSQISDRYGLLNIEVFNLLRDRETNESCIFGNMSLSEFNIIAFAYDGIIKGVGVPIVDESDESSDRKKPIMPWIIAVICITVTVIALFSILAGILHLYKWRRTHKNSLRVSYSHVHDETVNIQSSVQNDSAKQGSSDCAALRVYDLEVEHSQEEEVPFFEDNKDSKINEITL